MAKIKQLTAKKTTPSKLPLVIGYFNCVHVMHVQLLTKYHRFNVLTFKDFYSKKKSEMYSYEQRINNIKQHKPTNIYVLDLNKRNMTALDFIIKVLKPINPTEIVVGEDFKFGSDHKGIDFLKEYFKVEVIKYNKEISTTNIVKKLKTGNVEEANDFLYEPYYYQSKWVKGRKLGRTIGIKTINLIVDNNIAVPDGVYITQIQIGPKKYDSISFLGTSETTGSTKRTLECNVLNKKIKPRTIYPNIVRNHIKISFLKFVRKNRKFVNGEKLARQITKDQAEAIKYFKENI